MRKQNGYRSKETQQLENHKREEMRAAASPFSSGLGSRRAYRLLCMTDAISRSRAEITWKHTEGIRRERTHAGGYPRSPDFVQQSVRFFEQHAHREPTPFSPSRKRRQILNSLNRGGCYSRKKTNARVFLHLFSIYLELIVSVLNPLFCAQVFESHWIHAWILKAAENAEESGWHKPGRRETCWSRIILDGISARLTDARRWKFQKMLLCRGRDGA